MVGQFICVLSRDFNFCLFVCLFLCVNISNILVTVTLQSSNSTFNFIAIVCSHEHGRFIELFFLINFSYVFKD